MNWKNVITTLVLSILTAAGAIVVYDSFIDEDQTIDQPASFQSDQSFQGQTQLANFQKEKGAVSSTKTGSHVNVDFTEAAGRTTPSVVHVKTKVNPDRSARGRNPLRYFFDDEQWQGPRGRPNRPRQGSGSGVIVSSDGYIVTNNHVVSKADEIRVTLQNKRTYEAEKVGHDPMTDIALLKIDKKGLTPIQIGNSDSVQVGEWVLAVGNPFNLSSTVTAGIVSAKARNINILKDRAAIESFIQTDAAVNPGNSGGALVNLDGELIGLNTAIASPTGTYAGYAFAVPSNLMRKVVKDLKKYGIVQRGYLGVSIRKVDSETADKLGLNSLNGVYIAGVQEGSAAQEADLQKGDVIIGVNDKKVESPPELQQMIAQHRPGDQVTIHYLRDGKKRKTMITLKNKNQNTQLLTKKKVNVIELLGAKFEPLTKEQKKKLDVDHGVQVTSLSQGSIRKYTNMREGFVITHVKRKPVDSVDELISIVEDNKDEGVMVQGFYPGQPGTYYYAFGLS